MDSSDSTSSVGGWLSSLLGGNRAQPATDPTQAPETDTTMASALPHQGIDPKKLAGQLGAISAGLNPNALRLGSAPPPPPQIALPQSGQMNRAQALAQIMQRLNPGPSFYSTMRLQDQPVYSNTSPVARSGMS